MDDEDLDLSAWVAPLAPHNLADRVIARVSATDEAIAVVTQRRRSERRWWIGGALVAVMVGAAIAVFIVPRDTRSDDDAATTGIVATTRAQQLVLPGAIATLGPGTVLSWDASDGAARVQHHTGTVTWRVGARELVVEVGTASIEASNATLRVETPMNFSDTRVIGAAALTSAAVALVTVAVYEGQVKLSGAGQTVVVQPGMTYEVLPGQAPIHKIEDVDRALDEVEHTVAGTPPAPPPARTAPRPRKDRAVTVAEFEKQMKLFEPALDRCVKKWTTTQTLTLEIAATGSVTKASTTFADPATDNCVRRAASSLVFSLGGVALRGTYNLQPPCNPDDLQNAGVAAMARGEDAPALKMYEAALACKFDPHTLTLTFMAACRAHNLNAARRHWKQLNAEEKTHYLQMCLHEHITQDQLDE